MKRCYVCLGRSASSRRSFPDPALACQRRHRACRTRTCGEHRERQRRRRSERERACARRGVCFPAAFSSSRSTVALCLGAARVPQCCGMALIVVRCRCLPCSTHRLQTFASVFSPLALPARCLPFPSPGRVAWRPFRSSHTMDSVLSSFSCTNAHRRSSCTRRTPSATSKLKLPNAPCA